MIDWDTAITEYYGQPSPDHPIGTVVTRTFLGRTITYRRESNPGGLWVVVENKEKTKC